MTGGSLIIASEAAGSGMGRFTVELANAIEAAGVPVTVVARAQPYPLHTARRIAIAAPTAPGGWRKTAQLVRQSLAIAAAVWREAAKDRPLLLIHIAPTVPVSLAPLIAARLKGARIALSLHDFYPHTPRFARGLRGLERWLYRWAYRRCDLVVTNNPAQSTRLVAEAKVSPRRIETLFHGTFTIPELKRGEPGAALRLLVFGSLRPNKHVLETIRAVRRLRGEGQQVILRIAGAPRREDAAYWQLCQAEILADDPGFELYPRFIDDAEMPAIFAGIDALVCPYAGFDSQSGVAVTGVSNALPVIGTVAARVPHVELGTAPWPQIAEVADADAIAAALRAFIAIEPAKRQAFADDLQGRFVAAAGWDGLAANYLAAMNARGFWR